MNQIILKLLIATILLFITGCGFKVLDKSAINNFTIKKIESSGNSRINFKIKNNLLIETSKNSEHILSINLETNKVKSVKEKNIRNQVKKYNLLIISNVEVQDLKNSKITKFNISAAGDYTVADNYSITLTNERKTIETLTDELSEKILEKLSLKINDN